MIPDTLKTGSGEVKKLKLAPFQQVIIICSGSAASTIIQNLFVILKKLCWVPPPHFSLKDSLIFHYTEIDRFLNA